MRSVNSNFVRPIRITTGKPSSPGTGGIRCLGLWIVLCLIGASTLYGQQEDSPPAGTGASSSSSTVNGGSVVPRLITFSGSIGTQANPQGAPATQNEIQAAGASQTIGITFSLYQSQEGGSPLWSEVQQVQLDSQGHYTVLLGATQPDGLPLDLFTSGEAQWLGVQPQLPGAAEQPRVLLVGMPYALKASDADTLGGLPASAFLQAGATAQAVSASTGSVISADVLAAGQNSNLPPALGGGGTTDFLPLWTNSTTLGNSVLFQSGTGSSAKVGFNTSTPSTMLDVNGAGTVRGTLSLPATGTATSSGGKNSQPASLQASAFSSSTNAAVNQTFNLQAEPTGNDTTTPSGKLNLLFAAGSGTFAETGLSIASNGKITFASGQTFPGTGTITGVTTASGSGLTGGGTTGTLSVGLQKTCATNQVLQWNGSSWICASVGTGTITGVTTANGSGLMGGGATGTLSLSLQTTCATTQMLQWNGSSWVCATPATGTIAGVTPGTDLTGGGTSGTVTLNLDTTKVPQLNTANNFTGNQTVTGNLSASGQLISTVPTGTAPFGVSSTTQVLNLNASLLGGEPPSAFAQINGANTFTGLQTISTGDLSLASGDINLPQTTGTTTGVVKLGGTPFMHSCCSSGSNNTFLGPNAGNFSGTAQNTAVGSNALAANGLGYNTAIGAQALTLNTSSDNTATGYAALNQNYSGAYNAAFGEGALYSNTSGSINTALGYNADVANTGLTNATAIGAFAQVGESNAIVLGCATACNFGATPPDVGIGTATPGAGLEIDSNGGVNTPQAYLVQTNSNDYARLRLTVWSSPTDWDIAVGGGSNPPMNFYTPGYGNVISLTPGSSVYMSMGNGAYLTSGGAWTNSSDRNLKTGFRPVSGRDILRRLNAMPMTTWNYKSEGGGVRHIGPMAQDFRAAFGLGEDDKHITTIDEGGVALAAIQELDRELSRRSAQIEKQKEQIANLQARVQRLQRVQDRLAAVEERLALLKPPAK